MKVSDEVGEPFSPQIDKIPLASYLNNPRIRWSPLNRDYGFVVQSLDPSDTSLLQEHGNLTLDDAKKLARRNLDVPISNDRLVDTNLSSDQLPEATLEEGEREEASDEVEDESETARWPLILGALAVLGVAVILVRAFMRGRAS